MFLLSRIQNIIDLHCIFKFPYLSLFLMIDSEIFFNEMCIYKHVMKSSTRGEAVEQWIGDR